MCIPTTHPNRRFPILHLSISHVCLHLQETFCFDDGSSCTPSSCWPRLLLAKGMVVGQGDGCWPRLLLLLLAKVAVVGQGGGRWPRLLLAKVVVVLWAATDQRIRGNRVIGKNEIAYPVFRALSATDGLSS